MALFQPAPASVEISARHRNESRVMSLKTSAAPPAAPAAHVPGDTVFVARERSVETCG